MIEKDATGALNHALGLAGGAGREHDVERVIKGQLLET